MKVYVSLVSPEEQVWMNTTLCNMLFAIKHLVAVARDHSLGEEEKCVASFVFRRGRARSMSYDGEVRFSTNRSSAEISRMPAFEKPFHFMIPDGFSVPAAFSLLLSEAVKLAFVMTGGAVYPEDGVLDTSYLNTDSASVPNCVITKEFWYHGGARS